MPTGDNNASVKNYSDGFDADYIAAVDFSSELIDHYRFEEAWTVMETLRQESIPLLFNRALSLYEMDRFEEALKLTDTIISQLSTMKNRLPTPQGSHMDELHKVQRGQVNYLNPVSFRYVDMFPEELRLSALRLSVDLYFKMRNTDKVLELAELLKDKDFNNVNVALVEINYPDLWNEKATE